MVEGLLVCAPGEGACLGKAGRGEASSHLAHHASRSIRIRRRASRTSLGSLVPVLRVLY